MIVDEYDVVAMAGEDERAVWSTHLPIYESKWHSSAFGVDIDDLQLALGLDACGAH